MNYPAGSLIETFEISGAGPTGGRLHGKLYGGAGGGLSRHLRVYEDTKILYENQAVDAGNCTNALDWWLARQPWVPVPAALAAKFEEPGYKPQLKADGSADSVEAVYWLRWKAERQAAAQAVRPACDHCGEVVGEEYQQTAEDVICSRCVARARENRRPDPGFAADVKANGPPAAADLVRRIERGEIGPADIDPRAADVLTGRGPIGFDLGGEGG